MNKAGLPAKGSIQGIHFQPHTGPSSCPLSQPLDFRPRIWSEIPLGSSSLLSNPLVLICLFIFAMWSFSFLFWSQLSQQILLAHIFSALTLHVRSYYLLPWLLTVCLRALCWMWAHTQLSERANKNARKLMFPGAPLSQWEMAIS